MKRKIFGFVLLTTLALRLYAQSGTNSPYSQYGLGILSEQSQGFNRGMNGLAYGLRANNQINMLNPASYSDVDSLTMLFDVGVSGQITNFKEGGSRLNAKNANFEYAVALFRVLPRVGVSLGLVPYTNIGYNYTSSSNIGTSTTYTSETHAGEGGIHQAYIGMGWQPVKLLSIGANFSYLWGDYTKSITTVSNDTYITQVQRIYGASISSYKLDFGLQYHQQIGKVGQLTLGATVGLGHKLHTDPYVRNVNTNTQTKIPTNTADTIHNGLELPMTYGVGISYRHGRRFTIGADYSLQKWGSLKYPYLNEKNSSYELKSNLLRNRNKFTLGGEFVPNDMSRKFYNRLHYRVGTSYATPYYNINNVEGPKEISVSAGLGIPIFNAWNNRSMLNISGQWVRTSAKDLITENTFRINVAITFNERWFMKWKVD